MARMVVEIPAHGREPSVIERPEPERGPGESLVRLLAGGLNPVDLAIASGRFYLPVPTPPYVAGAEAVGEVVESDRFAAGTRVWGLLRTGAFAETFVAPDAALLEVPEGPSDEQAVAAGIAGLAGWMATVDRGGCRGGERVLVLGARGVVGQVAVAAARACGAARIVGVVRTSGDGQAVLDAGAHGWVTSEPERLEERIEDRMQGTTDLAVDTLWGEPGRAAVRSLGLHGRSVQVGNAAGASVELPAGPLRARRIDIRGFSVFNEEPANIATAYARLCSLLASGELALGIERVPFHEAPTAWERQGSGTGGSKLVLTPSASAPARTDA